MDEPLSHHGDVGPQPSAAKQNDRPRARNARGRLPSGGVYALAVATTVATLLLYLSLPFANGVQPAPIVFLLPIILSAYLGGLGPGLVSTALSAGLAWYFIMPPIRTFQLAEPIDCVRLVSLAAAGILISAVTEALHRARQRAEASQRLEAVTLASIGDAVITTDTQGRVTFLNAEAERLVGWRDAEAVGRPVASVFRIVSEQTGQPVDDPVQNVLRSGAVVSLANHTALLTRDGRKLPIEDSGAPIKQSDGSVAGVVLVFRDCTERRKAAAALAASERRVRLKLASILSPEGDVGNLELADIIDVEAIQLLMNDFYASTHIPMAIVDRGGSVLVGVGWQAICTCFHRIHPETCAHCVESDTLLSADVPVGEYKLYRCKNNMWDVATPIMVGDRRLGNVFTGQFFFDDEPLDYDLFRSQARRYGFKEAEYIAALDAVPRLSREKLNASMAFLVKLANIISQLSYSNVKLARSLAEREALMTSLRESEDRLRMAIESADLGTWDIDLLAGKIDWSERCKAIFGLPPDAPADYPTFLDRLHPEDRPRVHADVQQALDPAGQGEFDTEYRVLHPDGTERRVVAAGKAFFRPVDGQMRAIRFIGTVLDVTERMRLQEQLAQAQRMEAVGRLAGGVAHDFNNLLTAIIGQVEFALEDLGLPAQARDHLRPVLRSAERAATLTRQLLAFARKQVIQPKVVNANEIVQGLAGLLQRVLGENIRVKTSLARDLGNIEVDPGQYEQIIMNLATNARDAMPEGGALSIETANAWLDEDYARQHAGVAPGSYVVLSVCDTGVGMEESVQRHVFEPFFTTKGEGKGTGLGLATCHGIVAQCGGHIWVYSEPGRGTTFKIYFPRVGAPVSTTASAPGPGSCAGSEVILTVEDEATVRDLMARALRSRGYTVLEAGTGAEALAAAEHHDGAIDLIITDVILPDTNGRQLAQRLLCICPGAATLFVSGYTDSVITHHGVLEPGVSFLQKPYSLSVLAGRVREILDGARAASPMPPAT